MSVRRRRGQRGALSRNTATLITTPQAHLQSLGRCRCWCFVVQTRGGIESSLSRGSLRPTGRVTRPRPRGRDPGGCRASAATGSGTEATSVARWSHAASLTRDSLRGGASSQRPIAALQSSQQSGWGRREVSLGGDMRLRSSDVTWREIDGDLVILDLRSSTYLTTNASGALLMKELVEERTTADLVHSLVGAFGISEVEAQSDVSSFVQALDSGGLLEHANSA